MSGRRAVTRPRSPLLTPRRRSLRLTTTWSPTANDAGGRVELGPERTGRAHALARPRVEVGDVGAAVGDHHRRGRVTGGEPVVDEPLARRVRGRLDGDAVVAAVGGKRRARVRRRGAGRAPRAPRRGPGGRSRVARARARAARARGTCRRPRARAAGGGRRRARACRRRRGRRRRARRARGSGPCRPRRRRARTAPASGRPRVAQVGEQRERARALDPGAVLQLGRGTARDRDPEHRMAGGLPRLAGRGRARTSCPSRPGRPPPRPRPRRGRAARPRCAARPSASAAPHRPRQACARLATPASPRRAASDAVDQLAARARAARASSSAAAAGRPAAPARRDAGTPRPHAARRRRPGRPRARTRGSGPPPPRALARSTRAPGRQLLAERLEDLVARERRLCAASGPVTPASRSKTRSHSRALGSFERARPMINSSSSRPRPELRRPRPPLAGRARRLGRRRILRPPGRQRRRLRRPRARRAALARARPRSPPAAG